MMKMGPMRAQAQEFSLFNAQIQINAINNSYFAVDQTT